MALDKFLKIKKTRFNVYFCNVFVNKKTYKCARLPAPMHLKRWKDVSIGGGSIYKVGGPDAER